MKKIWLLLRMEAAGWKRRIHMVGWIVLIVVIISTFSYVRKQDTGEEKITLGVANEDTSEYAAMMLSYFHDNETFQSYVKLVEGSEEELELLLRAGELDGYLVIPATFAESMIHMENLPIRAVISMEYPTKALILRHVMEAYETYIEAVELNCTALYRKMQDEGYSAKERNDANVDISLDLIFTALGKDSMFRIRKLPLRQTGTLADHYIAAGLHFVLVFAFLPAGLQIISKKRTGLQARMRTMHISVWQMDATLLLPYTGLALILLTGFLWYKNVLEAGLLGRCVLLLLPWLFLFTVLGELMEKEQHYLFCAGIFILGAAILGGSLIPPQLLPEEFLEVTKWLPNYNFTELLTKAFQGGAVGL